MDFREMVQNNRPNSFRKKFLNYLFTDEYYCKNLQWQK